MVSSYPSGAIRQGIMFAKLPYLPESLSAAGFDITKVDVFKNASINDLTVFIEAKDVVPIALTKGEQQNESEFYPFGKDFTI